MTVESWCSPSAYLSLALRSEAAATFKVIVSSLAYSETKWNKYSHGKYSPLWF